MNCFTHPETPAVAFCRTCGKALCAECRRVAQGTVFCEEHAPPVSVPNVITPSPQTAGAGASPGLAFLLGLIPGVGAIYNGQYAKGLVHAIIFGLLISIVSAGGEAVGHLEPLFGILIAVWFFYMALEAYHTARRRQAGEPVDEFSSIVNLRARSGNFPAGAITLIVLGVILLLNTLEIIQFRYLIRYWPALLIVWGVYMLYSRVSGVEEPRGTNDRGISHERQ